MLLDNRYELNPATDLIGQGGFAKVYKAKDIKFDMPVAIKHFIGSKGNTGSVTREIKKCIHFNHPNIIRYYDCFEIQHTNTLGETTAEEYGVMEYADSGNMSGLIKGKIKVSDEEFREILKGFLDGLHYLHGRRPVIVHRDLKPSNILLHKENGRYIPKICDFGISKELGGTISATMTSAIGTIDFMSPEQINGSTLGPQTDLWALGCIVYEYFTKKSPFGKISDGTTAQQIYLNILQGTPDTKTLNTIPLPYRTLVQQCLVKDPKQRIQTAQEAKAILEGKTEKKEQPIPKYRSERAKGRTCQERK